MPLATTCIDCGTLTTSTRCTRCYTQKEREAGRDYYQSKHWQQLRSRVIRKYRKRCIIPGCGHTGNQVHHLIPRSQGGLDEESNLTLLCVECHEDYHADKAAGRTTQLTRTLDALAVKGGEVKDELEMQ